MGSCLKFDEYFLRTILEIPTTLFICFVIAMNKFNQFFMPQYRAFGPRLTTLETALKLYRVISHMPLTPTVQA